ncbi:MAG: hypothetical protein D6714_16640 [Bacteroidetes bacterium]|nr:MAG: hypothetical protein D6714_16640 [Bacteroidota bacterium]
MALIGKIRKNSWLLVVLIGLGLGGFVIMDMFSGQQSIFGSQQTILGEIEGKKVDINEFNRVESILYSGASGNNIFGNRNALWNYFVEEAIISDEAEELGLGVSDKELLDLEFGSNDRLSPLIKARYTNPNNPVAVDREQLNQIKGILDGGKAQMKQMIESGQLNRNFPYFWAQQEQEIKKERLQAKLLTMVEKAMYTPNWMAEMIANDQNAKVDFAYVQVPYEKIADNEVSLSDDDFQKYLNENKARFWQDEETRNVEFVVFNVKPSAKDSADIRKQIADLIPAFEAAEDDSLFVRNNFGTISQFWLDETGVPAAIKDTIFKVPVGSVYGPYLDADAYNAAKVLDRQMMPDSAKSRHILIAATTPEEFKAAEKTIDSLKTLLETGRAVFDTLAAKFSQDPGSAQKGGVYDYTPVNQFVPEYNDIIFYKGEIGKLYSVRTQFGVHLIEPMGRKGTVKPRVRLATISQKIIPSEETQETVLDQANNFLDENQSVEAMVKAVAARDDLELETSPPLKQNDFAVGSLGAGSASRDIVKWAFGTSPTLPEPSVGDVSPEVYSFQAPDQFYVNKYVVVGLKSIQEPGLPSVESIRDQIEPDVMKVKKGEMIAAQIAGKTDLPSIATQFQTKVDTAKNISFAGAFIPGIGSEPKVVATAFKIDLNTVSKPVAGNTGVFSVMPTYKPTAQAPVNIAQVRQADQNANRAQIRARLMPAVKKLADIEDHRSRFF